MAPSLKRIVRPIVESSASAAAIASATAARETEPDRSAVASIQPFEGARVSVLGPSTVQSRSLARKCSSAAAFASA